MERQSRVSPAHILLVEDNAADVKLTREALAHNKIRADLHVVDNGEDALRFLRQEGPYKGKPAPDLVLLDLNLPRLSGHEVLKEIRNDPVLADLPVVILTTSRAQRDIVEAYHLKVNCYVSKPVDFDEFVNVVQSIGDFWFTVVRLPPHRDLHTASESA